MAPFLIYIFLSEETIEILSFFLVDMMVMMHDFQSQENDDDDDDGGLTGKKNLISSLFLLFPQKNPNQNLSLI